MRCHPRWGYDLDAVPGIRCPTCGKLIGREEYVEETIWARFGQMMFRHTKCSSGDVESGRTHTNTGIPSTMDDRYRPTIAAHEFDIAVGKTKLRDKSRAEHGISRERVRQIVARISRLNGFDPSSGAVQQ